MALEIITSEELKDITFSEDESTILYVSDTNKIIYNKVNTIVDRPKRGDVMCINTYDNNNVVWVDGLSINSYAGLTNSYLDPVGICIKMKDDDDALVAYRENTLASWQDSQSLLTRYELNSELIDNAYIPEIPGTSPIPPSLLFTFSYSDNQAGVPVKIPISYFIAPSSVPNNIATMARLNVVKELNTYFSYNGFNFGGLSKKPVLISAELRNLLTNEPITDINTTVNPNDCEIILTVENSKNFVTGMSISNGVNSTNATLEKNLKLNSDILYHNTGVSWDIGVINKSQGYRIAQEASAPTETDTIYVGGGTPTSKTYFYTLDNCSYAREVFDNDYEKYFNALMVKNPNNRGIVNMNTTGKANTKKLTFYYAKITNSNLEYSILENQYKAAYYTATVNVNSPNLTQGNWWLPSASELIEINDELSFGTTYWGTNGKLDTLSQVILKLRDGNNNFNTTYNGWSIIDPTHYMWSSSISSKSSKPYIYSARVGGLVSNSPSAMYPVIAVTLYNCKK